MPGRNRIVDTALPRPCGVPARGPYSAGYRPFHGAMLFSGLLGGSGNANENGTGWITVRCLLFVNQASKKPSRLFEIDHLPAAMTLARSTAGSKVASGDGSKTQNGPSTAAPRESAYGPGHGGADGLPPST